MTAPFEEHSGEPTISFDLNYTVRKLITCKYYTVENINGSASIPQPYSFMNVSVI